MKEVGANDMFDRIMKIVKSEKGSKLKEKLVKEGIRTLPFRTRENVWPTLVGDSLFITDDYY